MLTKSEATSEPELESRMSEYEKYYGMRTSEFVWAYADGSLPIGSVDAEAYADWYLAYRRLGRLFPRSVRPAAS